MRPELTPDFIVQVLRFFAKIDCHDTLFWNIYERQPLALYVQCSDQFAWGTADAEEITPENFHDLVMAVDDAVAVAPDDPMRHYQGLMLFCSRQRKMRPQGCCYPSDRRLWSLFDDAGPPRKIDFNNPYGPGDRPSR